MQQFHLGGYLYPCNFCDFKTNYRYNDVEHMKRYHPEQYLKKRKDYLSKHFDLETMNTDILPTIYKVPTMESIKKRPKNKE